MSMKSYREDAKSSEKSVLSRRGFSPKENEPEGLIPRSKAIAAFADRKPTEAEKRAHGGKVIEHRMHGGKAQLRMDRFARGGHVKSKGKTTVNVVIAGQPGGSAAPPRPIPVPVPAGPMAGGPPPGAAMPPRPLPPPGPLPGGGAPGAMPPPGMAPMRKRGGKVEKDCDGGMVKRAFGGSVGGRGKDGPDAPKAPTNAGAGSGVGRMAKNGDGAPKMLRDSA